MMIEAYIRKQHIVSSRENKSNYFTYLSSLNCFYSKSSKIFYYFEFFITVTLWVATKQESSVKICWHVSVMKWIFRKFNRAYNSNFICASSSNWFYECYDYNKNWHVSTIADTTSIKTIKWKKSKSATPFIGNSPPTPQSTRIQSWMYGCAAILNMQIESNTATAAAVVTSINFVDTCCQAAEWSGAQSLSVHTFGHYEY